MYFYFIRRNYRRIIITERRGINVSVKGILFEAKAG